MKNAQMVAINKVLAVGGLHPQVRCNIIMTLNQMNKQEYARNIMSKTLEKVAKKLHKSGFGYELWSNKIGGYSWGMLAKNVKEDYINQVKTIADALDIIILPWDAEPEVGDVVHELETDNIFVVDDFRLATYGLPLEPSKLIQRNGKPVIQEDKPE